jgi:hypothetical protein
MKKKDRIWIYPLYTMVTFLSSLSISFKSIAQESTETVQDIDSNVYPIINIGKQVWMKEDLKTTRYSNGDSIGTTTTARRRTVCLGVVLGTKQILKPITYCQPSEINSGGFL